MVRDKNEFRIFTIFYAKFDKIDQKNDNKQIK